jgi:hypothetical protein
MVTTVLLSVKILTSSSAMSIAWADSENDNVPLANEYRK